MPELPRRFVIYLPVASPLEKNVCQAVELMLCDSLGGVTSYPARGIFIMADGKRRADAIQVVEAYCEADAWDRRKPFLWALAGLVGAVLHQETIACAVDGRMEMIPPAAARLPVDLEDKSIPECEAALTAGISEMLGRDTGGEGGI